MKVLVNLIGGQPAPVYIAIRILNPDKAILVYSKDSKAQLDRIQGTLPNYNYETLEVAAHDYEDCLAKIENVMLAHKSEEVTMNLTSGTKIMSLAAFRVFEESGNDIIYIDSQNHNLIRIGKGKRTEVKRINLVFGIRDYFSIYGFPIEISNNRFEDNESYRKIREFMNSYYFQFKSIISEAGKKLKSKETLLEAKDNSGQCYFRYNIKKNKGVIEITEGRKKQSIQLNSNDELDYAIGHWFEDFVFQKIHDCGFFDELVKQVKIYSIRKNMKPEYLNEFDICGIRNQTLYIFECKTGNIDKAIVEKLRLLKSITGTYSKIHLVTLFKPIESSALERIRDFNIKLVTKAELDEFVVSIKNDDVNPSV